MMYAVDALSLTSTDRTETEYFEELEEAVQRAKELETDEWRVYVSETTGEPFDEGKVIFDY